MYASNSRARAWLIKNKYTDIYFKPHTRYDKDIFGLWDGLCYDRNGNHVWVQIKTNAWPSTKKILAFLDRKNVGALAINVRGRFILIRTYIKAVDSDGRSCWQVITVDGRTDFNQQRLMPPRFRKHSSVSLTAHGNS